jgi:hypothetical protein
MDRRRRITVAGSVAQRPGNGGHTWVFLQYLLGFRRLGYDVLFLDRIEPQMCTDRAGNPSPVESSWNIEYFRDVMNRHDLAHAYALFYDGGRKVIGRSRDAVETHVGESDLLLNVMGFFDAGEILSRARLKAFLDIDPGFGQMWKALGLHDLFVGHDAYVTIGENIGKPTCEIPTVGIDWITTPQPVVLEHWPVMRDGHSGAFTGIATWRGPFGPVEYNGKTYGLRVHEFRKFATLPTMVDDADFEIALDIHSAETKDLALLQDNEWRLADPKIVAADPDAYRRYIQQSMAELMIAKNMYVATRGGWFSDRSICYLASGKPVLAQDTGLAELYPTDTGLVTFSTLPEAAAGAQKIAKDYDTHAAAARKIAEDHFDSDKVLPKLLKKLGVSA